MAHPDDSDHGASNFGVTPAPLPGRVGVSAAVGTPRPRPPKGRPPGNGALGPIRPVPGLGDFKGKPSRKSASKV